MSMKDTITVTSKGQTTLPAPVRRQMGLDSSGGVLQIRYDERSGELVISRPVTIAELSDRTTSFIKPGIEPIRNVDEYYQANRRSKQ